MLVCLTAWLVLGAVQRVLGGRDNHKPGDRRFAGVLAFCAAAAGLASYVGLAVWYAADPHFFDNAEPTMPAVAWAFHSGQPLYLALDAAERYSHIYGPLAFLLHAWALELFGAAIGVSKAVGAAAGIGSLAVTFVLLRRAAAPARAAVMTGICAIELLLFRHYSYWTRPDSLEVLGVAAATLFAAQGGLASAAAAGVMAGAVLNLKFTGVLYVLPAFVLLHQSGRWKRVGVASAAALIVAIAPFALPDVSLVHYRDWLRTSAQTGLLLSTVRQNIEWACYLSLPLLFSYFGVSAAERTTGNWWSRAVLALALGMTGVAVAGAKPGAGVYHLMPFVPVIAYLCATAPARASAPVLTTSASRRGAIAFVAVAALLALATNDQFVRVMIERRQLDELTDILHFADTHGEPAEMGYGLTESLSFERPALVFRTGHYFLDQPAIREQQLQGIAIPNATLAALASCRITFWLIPKGEEPFSDRNSYSGRYLEPLYPPAFRQAFLAAHRRVEQTRYFDVWQCQPAAPRR